MNKTIKLIENNANLEEIKKSIIELEKEDRKNIVIFFLSSIVKKSKEKNKVSDNFVFNLFKVFIDLGINFSEINGLMNFIIILNKHDKRELAKLLLALLKQRHIEEKLFVLFKLFQNSGTKVKFLFNKITNLNQFRNTVFNELQKLVKSYNDKRFFLYVRKEFSSNEDNELWKSIHLNEIENRLTQLSNMFGKKIMKAMNLPLIMKSEYNNLSCIEKVIYCEKICHLINVKINEIKEEFLRLHGIKMVISKLIKNNKKETKDEEKNEDMTEFFSDSSEKAEDDIDISIPKKLDEHYLESNEIEIIDLDETKNEICYGISNKDEINKMIKDYFKNDNLKKDKIKKDIDLAESESDQDEINLVDSIDLIILNNDN